MTRTECIILLGAAGAFIVSILVWWADDVRKELRAQSALFNPGRDKPP